MIEQMNILTIMMDHIAYYNHKDVKMPNFQRLKDRGVYFPNAYCASPLCAPSRRSLFTGLYPSNHGQLTNGEKIPIKATESYFDVFMKNGYKNYYFGKCHASSSEAISGLNGALFTDDGYGNPYGKKEYKDYINREGLPKAKMFVERNFSSEGDVMKIKENEEYDFPRAICETLSGILMTPKETHESYFLADMARRQLEELSKSNEKFNMRVDFWGPHHPYSPTQEFINLYDEDEVELYPSFSDDLKNKPSSHKFELNKYCSKNKEIIIPNPMEEKEWKKILTRCYGMISMCDDAMGKIIDKLEELNMFENTIVIFATDHGDAICSHGGHFDKSSYMTEEVMRIPLVIVDPKIGKKVCNEFISNIDLAPTMLAYGGLCFSEEVDGRDIGDIFIGNNWKDTVYAQTHGHFQKWFGRMVRFGNIKYVLNKGDMNELYDLEKDPYEMNNLIDQKGYENLQNIMSEKMKDLFEKYQ
ncbi:MAG: sulfatase-like hydrolase/transferase [Lachnospirales bacterium]